MALEPTSISELDDKISQLETELHKLRLRRNELTKFGGLPAEVLVMICAYVQDPAKPRTIISMIHVCSRVYYTAIDAACLWNTLHWQQSENWQKLCLSRSKGLPLHIFTGECQTKWDDNMHHKPYGKEIFLAAVSAEVQVLETSHSGAYFSVAEMLLTAPAPLMRILRIFNSRPAFRIGRNLLGGHLEHLNTLELHDVELNLDGQDSRKQWDCPLMRRLRLVDCRGRFMDFYRMLSAMPHLTFLEISEEYCLVEWSALVLPADTAGLAIPVRLPNLDTFLLDVRNPDTTLALLSLVPDPHQHFDISILFRGQYSLESIDSHLNTVIVARLRSFWESATTFRILPSVKAVVEHLDFESGYPAKQTIDCTLVAGNRYDELCWPNNMCPSLFMSFGCKLDSASSDVLPMITTLELDLDGNKLGLKENDVFNIDYLTGVHHIIINRGLGPHGIPWHEDESTELLDWVGQRAAAGTPLESITFKKPEWYYYTPQGLAERLLAAGGEGLQVYV